ncbi:hypothetical protein F0562_007086 [Nyssa sinensis]|uniref:Retrovirus-related Pol polyprotein from transposon TNT 1-94-like beta-barrel domain-containing protein n=1 Tax=Nyssa sinensis TaxID=561372 RepID=A0A5J5A736_9ASTE|nr:hypothetical protein F0562_007086 [Nyssa sinensis]
MANTNSSVSHVPVFDGENYDFWCIKMKTFFISQDLWDLVESGFAEPESTATLTQDQAKALKENIQRDARALNQIQEGVSNSIFPRIMRATRSKQAWEILQQEYQGDLKARTIKLQNLRRDFETMKMKENETLNDFSTRFSELVNQMKTYGEDISDARIVEKILISLPDKFDAIVVVVEETKDISKLSIQELMGSLKSYEQRLSRHSEKSLESAFQSKLNFSSENAEKKSSTQEQSKGESSKGGRQGRRRDCRIKTNQQASFTEEKEGEGNLFYACQAATVKKNGVWFLNSGCSNHTTSNKIIFIDMDKSINSQVKMGNGALVQAQGKGTIGIETKKGTKFIRDVLLVPDLENNLLSVGQLVEHGYSVHFKDDCCIIYDERRSR